MECRVYDCATLHDLTMTHQLTGTGIMIKVVYKKAGYRKV